MPGVGRFTAITAPGTDGYTGVPLTNEQVAQDYTPRRRQDNEAVALTLDWTARPVQHAELDHVLGRRVAVQPRRHRRRADHMFKIPYYRRDAPGDPGPAADLDGRCAAFSYIVGAYYQHEMIYNSTENQIYHLTGVQD